MWYPFVSLTREPTILLTLALILTGGFALTRLTKRIGAPSVSGYILAGILIGPYALGLIDQATVNAMDFASDIALAFIAFGVGRFFKKETLRTTGPAALLITLLESLLPGVLVTLTLRFLFRLELAPALLLGSIATATAPASTAMTIRQYGASGSFVDVLLQVTALDDGVCLIVFSLIAAVIQALDGQSSCAATMVWPLVCNAVAVGLGAGMGRLLSVLLPPSRSADNRLILLLALLLALCGACCLMDVSPLLACMVFGAVYINTTRDSTLFDQLDTFSPPVTMLFFVLSGMRLDLRLLAAFGLAGVGYFAVRIAGKYLGAALGCALTRMPKPVCRYLGLALVPQAGVAIGLTMLAQRLLPGSIGELVTLIVLSSSVLYELIGPACAKFALARSGSIAPEALQKQATPRTFAPRRRP